MKLRSVVITLEGGAERGVQVLGNGARPRFSKPDCPIANNIFDDAIVRGTIADPD